MLKIYSLKLKRLSLFVLLLQFIFQVSAQHKVTNSFGLDADQFNDTMISPGTQFGTLPPVKGSNDWFYKKFKGARDTGYFAIDTTGAAKILADHNAGTYYPFQRGMSVAPYEIIDSFRFIWAAYLRDEVGTDNTTFSGGDKNADNPMTQWGVVSGSIPDKNDLVDGAVFVMRSGLKPTSHLYMYGMSTIYANTGDRNIDYELFRTEASVSGSAFINTGADDGHSAWRFDSNGALKTYGDILVSVEGSGTQVNLISLRIWMKKSTYDSMIAGTHPLPSGGFTLSSNFEVGTSGLYGYAEVNYSASGSTEFFYGKTSSTLGNTPAQPWGTFGKSGGTSGFRASNNFPGQFLEFGLDLTYMGIDPYQFKTVDTGDWCNPSFGSVMMKSRTSSSFASALKDFIGPASFVLPPISVEADATSGLDCISTNACAVVTNRTGNNRNNWYEWVNTNTPGTVVDTGVVFCTTTPGNYKVYAMRGDGCRRVDSTIITVAQDKRQPIATATVFDTLVVNAVYNVQLFGGSQYLTDSVMALDSVIFGPSQGLQYSWVGTSPGSIGFVTTTNQNPIVSDSGFYRLIVTEPRNGCKDTALALVVMLPVSWGDFYCNNLNNGTVALNWTTLSEKDVDKFEVQKLKNNVFETVGVVDATGNSNWPVSYHFNDKISSESSRIFYRVKMVADNGSVEYSDVCETNAGSANTVGEGGLLLYPNPADQQVEISLMEPTQTEVNVLMFDVLGRQMKSAVIAEGETSVKVNVANLTPGVYWLTTGESKNHSSVIFIKK